MSQRVPDSDATAIQLKAMRLLRVEYSRLRDSPKGRVSAEISFGLGATGLPKNHFQVDLSVSASVPEVFSGEVTYSARFGPSPIEDDQELISEKEIREFVAQVAPTVIYPYARQTLTDMVEKSGLPAFFLPVMNFRDIFDPSQLDFVPLPREESQDNEGAPQDA